MDYSRINDLNYVNEQISSIQTCMDKFMLYNELKRLSIKISSKKVSPETAELIKVAIINRLDELRVQKQKIETLDSGRSIKMNPTAVSNHNGTVNLTLLLTGISATLVMYALLLVSQFIK